MKVDILALVSSIFLANPVLSEAPLQVKRDAIGRSCHSMIIYSDPVWLSKNSNKYRPLCTCAVERVLEVGFSADHISPGMYKDIISINSEGRHLIRRKLMACVRDMPEGTGPEIKIPNSIKPQSW